MEIMLYQIDAFTDKTFQGNPAAVCPLKEWLPDDLLQAIATENNLSETAFFVPHREKFHIRWFTPVREVKLCGHATLATAYVLFNCMGYDRQEIKFESKSGQLVVFRDKEWLVMDFPSQPVNPCTMPKEVPEGLGKTPVEALSSEDYMAVFENQEDIISIIPNFAILNNLGLRGLIITARGEEVDFVSRFFAPKYGINEDPVTGSAHCELTPYWAKKLNRKKLTAKQLSKRGGELICELRGDRVFLSGKAVKYMEAKIDIET